MCLYSSPTAPHLLRVGAGGNLLASSAYKEKYFSLLGAPSAPKANLPNTFTGPANPLSMSFWCPPPNQAHLFQILLEFKPLGGLGTQMTLIKDLVSLAFSKSTPSTSQSCTMSWSPILEVVHLCQLHSASGLHSAQQDTTQLSTRL